MSDIADVTRRAQLGTTKKPCFRSAEAMPKAQSDMLQLTRARVMAWLLVLAAFAGVWFGAKSTTILFITIVGPLPLQFVVSRKVLRERRYPTWFAGFALLLGPMGTLLVLAL